MLRVDTGNYLIACTITKYLFHAAPETQLYRPHTAVLVLLNSLTQNLQSQVTETKRKLQWKTFFIVISGLFDEVRLKTHEKLKLLFPSPIIWDIWPQTVQIKVLLLLHKIEKSWFFSKIQCGTVANKYHKTAWNLLLANLLLQGKNHTQQIFLYGWLFSIHV